jgi:uncharacterized protein
MQRVRRKLPRVVVDPNVWISVLIGKALKGFADHVSKGRSVLIISPELIEELHEVTNRPKFRKYFPIAKVSRLIELLVLYGELVEDISFEEPISRDPKDDYLLAIAVVGRADILITGDTDLLVLGTYKGIKIMSPSNFSKLHLAR